jgi:hypothetical protein
LEWCMSFAVAGRGWDTEWQRGRHGAGIARRKQVLMTNEWRCLRLAILRGPFVVVGRLVRTACVGGRMHGLWQSVSGWVVNGKVRRWGTVWPTQEIQRRSHCVVNGATVQR